MGRILSCSITATRGLEVTLLAETELRLVVRILAVAFSAASALSSACSRSCCALRNLAKLAAASSSCLTPNIHRVTVTSFYSVSMPKIDFCRHLVGKTQ